MARFYGFSHDQIQGMEYDSFLAYVKALDVLRARETLVNIQVSSFPNSKKEYQRKIHKDLHRIANPDLWDAPKKPLTTDELARILGNGRR